MRYTAIISLTFLILISSLSQTNPVPPLRLSNNKTDRVNPKSLLNYDSGGHLGVEYGQIFSFNNKTNENNEKFTLGSVWLFDDYSIYKNIIGFKFKAGVAYQKIFEYQKINYIYAVFLSGGINAGGLQFGRHFLSLYAGYSMYLSYGLGAFIFEISPKYVFKINKDFGLSAGMTCALPGYNIFQLMPSLGFQYFY
jgi:hypothetical protein